MKIVIENFGPIRKFEFDTSKKLHLLYGENNVGKSYAVSVIYLILKNLGLYGADFLTESFQNTFSQNLEDLHNKFSKSDFSISIISENSEIICKLYEKKMKLSGKIGFYGFPLYFLPASRSGLYLAMNNFNMIFSELSQRRFLLKNTKVELPNLSEPISDFFLELTKINEKNKTDFTYLAKKIEKNILNGKVVFNELTRKIEFHENKTKLKLELWQTSSMISELSLVVAYLKYIVNRGSLLFIEEPEVHLHPKAQVLLMEIFTELANQGLQIVCTTHSNYMFFKLINLILDKKIITSEVESFRLIKTKHGSIDANDMTTTDEGIKDNNFAAITKQLYNERMQIIEKQNNIS